MANSTMETTFQNLINVIKEKTAPISHQHTKNQITDFPESMPASDVYEWAKATTKPEYTASEVGALSASDGQTIALQVAQLSASKLSISQVGVPNGVASLDENGKVIELPTNLLTSSQLGIAGGIASLGNDGKVPTEQLPSISGGDTVPGFKPIDFGAFYQGSYIWSDGTDIYYSKAGTQKVFDKTTKTWSNKTWNGRTNFDGNKIWSDGTDYYYSAGGGLQFKLNKETSTWESITFPTFNAADGGYVWWDGTKAQYNNSTNKYTYNKATQDWETQTSPVAPYNFNGSCVWTDGTDIYLSYQGYQYVLDKVNMTWVSKTWTGCTNFNGDVVWTDGINTYISGGTSIQYILDKENSNWVPFNWYGPMINLYGYNVWTDGTDIYYDNGSFTGTLYKFNPFELMGVANGIAELDADGRIPTSQTNYVSAGQKANTTLGSRATAEGTNTTASHNNAHAEGANTKATNSNAHVEGNYSTASGSDSHAEGSNTTASGNYSHAEGYYADTNSKHASHAEGYYTKTGAVAQHVEGSYNKGENFTRHEVGNGTSTSNRSNVFEITMGDEVVTYGKNYVVSEKTNIANVADCGTIQSIAIAVSDAGVVTVTYSNGTETTYNMTAGHTGIFAWNSKTSDERVYIKKGDNYTFTFSTTRPSLLIDSVKMTVIDDEVTDSHGNVLSDKVNTNDSRLSDSRPASDVYSWAKAANKPSYSYSEISGTPSSLPASDVPAWAKAESKPSYSDSEITNLGLVRVFKPAYSSSDQTFTLGSNGEVYVIVGFEIHNNGRRAGVWLATYSSVSGEGFGLVTKLIGGATTETHMDVTVSGNTLTLKAGFATAWTVYKLVNNLS